MTANLPPVVIYNHDLVDDVMTHAILHRWTNGVMDSVAMHSRCQIMDNRIDSLVNRDVIFIKPRVNVETLLYLASRNRSLLVFTNVITTIQALLANKTKNPQTKGVIVTYGQGGDHVPSLVWQTVMPPGQEVPVACKFIKDSLERTTRHPNAIYLRTYLSYGKYGMDDLQRILSSDIDDLVPYFRDGKMIREARNRMVEHSLEITTRKIQLQGIEVSMASAIPAVLTETAEQLAEKHGIGLAYYDTEAYRQFVIVSFNPHEFSAMGMVSHLDPRGDSQTARFQVARTHPLSKV